MKKICLALAALLVCLSGMASAAEGSGFEKRSMMLEGTVEAGNTVAVMAPFGGVLLDNSLQAGDMVSVGDVLHTIETTKVYAPVDGAVGGVRVRDGDNVVDIQNRYTALLYIEPASAYVISTTTKNAFDRSENYYIHAGEQVYLRSNSTRKRSGIGFVTVVDGSDYTVEVLDGNLQLDESTDIYRDPDYKNESRIGTGSTERNADVAITVEEGSVYKVHVQHGDVVKRGDLLLEVVTGTIPMQDIPSNEVKAEKDGVVATVDAAAGDTVAKNQLLSTLYPMQDFQVKVPVSEMDLPHVGIGDTVRIELTNVSEQPSLTGRVESISGLNSAEASEDADASDATYNVFISFSPTDIIRQGMNVNVYFNEQTESAYEDDVDGIEAELPLGDEPAAEEE